MLLRYLKFYIGAWLPLAACWLVIVLVAAWHYRSGLGTGLLAATVGTLSAVGFAAHMGREDKKGSITYIAAHPEYDDHTLFRLGLKKGVTLGIVSLIGVACIFCAPFVADHILTALGK